MTLQEFEVGYARRSNLTLVEFYDLGLRGEPCDCGEPGCEGWKTTTREQRAQNISGGVIVTAELPVSDGRVYT